MSDPARESAAILQGPSTTRTATVGTLVGFSGILLIVPTFGGPGSATTVGLVLGEALALHVGYGVLARLARSALRETLGGD